MNNNNALARGLRNHNPLNIKRTADKWLGLSAVQLDPVFCQFVNADFGYRAAYILLGRYYYEYGLKTISKIISRWCPPSPIDDTDAYIRTVSSQAAFPPDEPLPSPLDDAVLWVKIVAAMTRVENGQAHQVDMTAVLSGYQLAKARLKVISR